MAGGFFYGKALEPEPRSQGRRFRGGERGEASEGVAEGRQQDGDEGGGILPQRDEGSWDFLRQAGLTMVISALAAIFRSRVSLKSMQ